MRIDSNNSRFEDVIEKHGVLIYGNVGDSMMPLVKQGRDRLVIVRKPAGRLKKYDVPLYRRDNGQYVLHRIVRVTDDAYVMLGDNRWALEYGITDRQIIGVLSAVIRKGRTVPVSSLQYRCYVFLWCRFLWLRRALVWVLQLPHRFKYRKLTKKPT
ncbi:MAG: S24/S26 family peptidase [Paludibacteraceae bacterium]|nr:S24/S26 family peptidase [Paludibacteraceae bacterium]